MSKMSKAGRAAIAKAQRERWAKVKAAKQGEYQQDHNLAGMIIEILEPRLSGMARIEL